jgi:hypothetical protein
MTRLFAFLAALLLLSSCDLREHAGPTKPLAHPSPSEGEDPPPPPPGEGEGESQTQPWVIRLVEFTDYARHKKYAQVRIDGDPKCKQYIKVGIRWQSVVGSVTRMNVSLPYADQGSIWPGRGTLILPFVNPDTSGLLVTGAGACCDDHPTGNGVFVNTQWKAQPDSLWPGGIVKLWLVAETLPGPNGGPIPLFYTDACELPVVLSSDTLVFHVQPDGTF